MYFTNCHLSITGLLFTIASTSFHACFFAEILTKAFKVVVFGDILFPEDVYNWRLKKGSVKLYRRHLIPENCTGIECHFGRR